MLSRSQLLIVKCSYVHFLDISGDSECVRLSIRGSSLIEPSRLFTFLTAFYIFSSGVSRMGTLRLGMTLIFFPWDKLQDKIPRGCLTFLMLCGSHRSLYYWLMFSSKDQGDFQRPWFEFLSSIPLPSLGRTVTSPRAEGILHILPINFSCFLIFVRFVLLRCIL